MILHLTIYGEIIEKYEGHGKVIINDGQTDPRWQEPCNLRVSTGLLFYDGR
jgi:hypothetical protein